MTDEELSAAIREVQQRARARAPQGALGLDGVEAADLMPLVHARDAAQAKVAAIGTVNPRPPGLLNSAVQTAKRATARALDWHVREQVEFNRAAMACVEASIAAMTGMSRSLAGLAAHIASDRAAHRDSSQVAEEAHQAHQRELQRQINELHALCSHQAAALEEFRSRQATLFDEVRLQFDARVEELRHEHAGTMEAAQQQQKVRMEALRQEHAGHLDKLGGQHSGQMDALRQDLVKQVAEARQEHGENIGALRREQGEHIEALRQEQGGLMVALRNELGGQMAVLRQEHDAQEAALRREFGPQVEALRYEYGAQVEALRLEHGEQLEALRLEYGTQAEALRTESGEYAEQLRLRQATQFEEWRVQQGAMLDAVREEIRGGLTSAAESQSLLQDRVAAGEAGVSRTVSELEAVYQQRLARQEEVFREHARTQHQDFAQALDRNTVDVQKRLWEDLAKVREEFEGLIHRELRLLRQRESLPVPTVAAVPAASGSQAQIGIDWLHFAERFRGSEERIRGQQQRYVQQFAGTKGKILDIGCGRGEFLEALRDAGLSGLGIDSNAECVELCRSKGLRAECVDLFAYLEAQENNSLAGAYCAQVIEHLAPEQVAGLVRLLGAKLRAGSWVALETPNPECLAIFATYFYADPTHTRPVPAPLLRFYLEEAGFGSIAVERMNPAVELLPAIGELPAAVQDGLFGGLDYAIFARKL